MAEPISFNEERIRKITFLYYSRPEIQKAIFEFSKNREVSPRYFEGFGKRPDVLEYPGDIFELVKKGATSFHCSEELWSDALKIETGMNEKQLNNIRKGWDLLIDIDCKWFDFSKKAARAIINTLNSYGVKNIGIKFSGSKGFHIIVPWKSFPKEIAGEPSKNLFPELPRKIVSFLRFKSEEEMKRLINSEDLSQFDKTKIKKGIKCNNCKSVATTLLYINYICPKCRRQEFRKIPLNSDINKVYKCPDCRTNFDIKDSKEIFVCNSCNLSSEKNSRGFSRYEEYDLFDLMGLDLVLVSPRHLFRAPYSLHEKTSLASVVIDENELDNFNMKDADPMKAKPKDFIPNSSEGEAEEFVREALDWYRENQSRMGVSNEKLSGTYAEFKPIKILNLTDELFPPSIKKILEGVGDGRKRALFILINFFRSIGIEKEDMEKKIYEWNNKNEVPLKEGYVMTQLKWAYGKKPILPPNFSADFYSALGIIPTPEEIILKNPVNYVIKKNTLKSKSRKK
jgi:DNA primase catalytic subunit